MKKEHFISYKHGITRSPSDFLCEDGTLSECINLTTSNGELRPIRMPKKLVQLPGEVIYVHLTNSGTKNYIYHGTDGIYYRSDLSNSGTKMSTGDIDITKTIQMQSIGNTLILSNKDGIYYLLWKNDNYIYLGNKIMEPEVEFKLSVTLTKETHERRTVNKGNSEGILVISTNGSIVNFIIQTDKQDSFNDLVIGLYEKNKKDNYEKKRFVNPFFVRYALKLYDESYAYISNPILMFPSITQNSYATNVGSNFELNTYGYQLYYKNRTNYKDWSDIVKGITIFVSNPIEIYDLTTDQKANLTNDIPNSIFARGENASKYETLDPTHFEFKDGDSTAELRFACLTQKSTSDIIHEIKNNSVFFKLCDITEAGSMNSFESLDNLFTTNTIENITTQEQLTSEDYYSRCPLTAKSIFTYNQRLNLSNVSRGFYEGFGFFMPLDYNDGTTPIIKNYLIRVRIKTGKEKDAIVTKAISTAQRLGYWFYYPDPRAYQAEIFQFDGTNYKLLKSMTLTEHTGLNGSYYFPDDLPNNTDPNTLSTTEYSKEVGDNTPEMLFNKILQSEVNNPFIFSSKGYNTIGKGMIIGISTNTIALSQGQFGQHPLLVFSSDGIWAIPITNTGTYQPAQPMSREICSNAASITQTDNAVFFVSKKGLMMVSGNMVKYVTPQMEGPAFINTSLNLIGESGTDSQTNYAALYNQCAETTSFRDFLQTCKIAYDYVERKLYLINTEQKYFYLFDLSTEIVTKGIFLSDANFITVTKVVNDYPDSLIQDSSFNLYTLYNKEQDENITDRFRGILLTRPLKLTMGNTMKTITDILNVGYWSKESEVKMKLYISDDLCTWYPKNSKAGVAGKYFRIVLFSYLKPQERLSGTIIIEEPRRADQLR